MFNQVHCCQHWNILVLRELEEIPHQWLFLQGTQFQGVKFISFAAKLSQVLVEFIQGTGGPHQHEGLDVGIYLALTSHVFINDIVVLKSSQSHLPQVSDLQKYNHSFSLCLFNIWGIKNYVYNTAYFKMFQD